MCVVYVFIFLPDEGKPHPVLSYLQGLQKELGTDSGPWSTNLLKAATYICDKLQTSTPTRETPTNNLFFSSLSNNNNSNYNNNNNNISGGFINRLRRTGSSISLSGKGKEIINFFLVYWSWGLTFINLHL